MVELSSIDSNDLIKIFSFKFLVYFRSKIPEEWYPSIIELLFGLMKNNTPLYINGALLSLEKFLFTKSTTNQKEFIFSKCVNEEKTLVLIINGLIATLKQYNQQSIICFYKTLLLINDENFNKILHLLPPIITDIFNIILSIKTEKFNSEYNYQFFEMVGYIFSKIYKIDLNYYNKFKNELNLYLELIMKNNIFDLYNYLFQIYAIQLSLDKEYTNMQTVKIILFHFFKHRVC